MSNFYTQGVQYQSTANACVIDITPPVFAGINSLTPLAGGQLRAVWLAATDPTLPIRYEIYAKELNDTDLFNVANIVGITSQLQFDVLFTPIGGYLQASKTYYVGVRALDGVSNRDANLISLGAISLGVTIGGIGAVSDQLAAIKQLLIYDAFAKD